MTTHLGRIKRARNPESSGGKTSRLKRRTLFMFLMSAAFIVGLSGVGQASPAAPDVISRFTQPDGSKLQLKLWGDEFANGYETLHGITVVQARSGEWQVAVRNQRGELKASGVAPGTTFLPVPPHLRPSDEALNRSRARFGVPPIGSSTTMAAPAWAGNNTDVLFLAVEFSDRGCTFTPAQMADVMFGTAATGPGNLEDYFEEVSGGALDVDGRVIGNQANTDCIALPESHGYYDQGPGDAWEAVEDALDAADPYVDFDDYDNDGDGVVDQLGIIYAGGGPHDGCDTDNAPTGNGGGDGLWPHFSGNNSTGTDDDADVQNYIINSELTRRGAFGSPCNDRQSIGLFVHEMGHGLGVPDLYDTDGSSPGVSSWSAMASQYLTTTVLADTPPHYDPWTKWRLDWVTPTEYTGQNTVVTLDDASTSGEVAQILPNPLGAEQGGAGEYFLVENRQQNNFDGQLVGCGVLVWHIEETQTHNQNEGHSLAAHRLVDIEEADGLDELDADGGDPDAGDPFPGTSDTRLFDGASDPSSDLYSGVDSGVRLRIQDTCDDAMRVSIGPNDAPNAEAGGPYGTVEGTDVAVDGRASSDPDADPVTYAWDLDNDGQYDDSTSETPDFTSVGQDGAFTVGLRVTDPYGLSDTDTATVNVTNVAPTLTTVTATSGPQIENSPVQVTASIADAGWLDDLSATIDWNDGTPVQTVADLVAEENARPNASGGVDVTRTYGDDGTFTITVCGLDDDTSVCTTRGTTLTNANPTVAIDLAGSTIINGVQTIIGNAGEPVIASARSTDRGSDDLEFTWNWGDGSPETKARYLNDMIHDPDPDPSPTVNPRDVTDTQSHTYAEACVYQMTTRSDDDDGGSASDNANVIITGNADAASNQAFWKNQYKQDGRHASLERDDLKCYLAITRYGSDVFSELRALSTFSDAEDVLNLGSSPAPGAKQFDRELLASWLNFANGAYSFDGPTLDTNGDGTPDLSFGQAVTTAEAVRLDPLAAKTQLDRQRKVLADFNGSAQ